MPNKDNKNKSLKETTNNGNETVSQFQDEQCNEIVSGPPSLGYSCDNEEEYLRATFDRLGVGHDGFISLEELAKVCHAIGMEKVAAEEIDQLFSRLDVDGDGKISFEEFLHMFQGGGPDTITSNSLEESLIQDTSLLSNPGCLPTMTNQGMLVTEYGLFSTLDPEGTGYVSVPRLVEAWFSVGLNDGGRLLRELGLPFGSRQRVRLRDLAAALEEELRPSSEAPQLPRHAAFLTLLHEIKSLRCSLEAARGERDKCRWDLGEANHRLALLAQELDDHNATMESNAQKRLRELEKQYKEQIRHLQEALTRERENGRENALSDSKELLSINSHLQEEETRLKALVSSLELDVKKLEVENLELGVKLAEAQNHSHAMEKQVHELNMLKSKVAEYESLSPRQDEFRRLVTKVDELLTENQSLRDSNDELIAQVDAYAYRFATSKHEDYSLDGSCIGDYLDHSMEGTLMGGIKRRSGSSPFRRSSPEEGNSDEEESSPRGSKIRKRNSPQMNFHYVDVTGHDESFTNTYHHIDDKILGTSGTPTLTGLRPPTDTLKTSPQPSSLPLFLSLMSPGKRPSLTKVEELEMEIKTLTKEKEQLSQEVARTKRLLEQTEASSTLRREPNSHPTENSSSTSPSYHKIRFGRKCQQCAELESRLNLALEELEMALKREKQKLFNTVEESDVSATRKQAVIAKLEEDLRQVTAEAQLLTQERNQLLREKEAWSGSSRPVETLTTVIHDLCQELCNKLRRKHSRVLGSPQSDSVTGPSPPPSVGRDAITTIIEEEEPEEGADERGQRTEAEVGNDKAQGMEEVLRRELEGVEKVVTRLSDGVARERERVEKDKAVAEDRLSRSEQDFQVLRSEFEKSEDYWNLKFQEEQDYYDEERKLYDEKFSALEAKIKEYEALASSGGPIEVAGPSTAGEDALSDDSDDRLSTIEESVVWERQVTDLEEEVRCLQKKLLQVNEEKENASLCWREKLSKEQSNWQQEIHQLKTDLEQSRAKCLNLESQRNCVLDELAHFKKNFGHEEELMSILNQENMNGCETSADGPLQEESSSGTTERNCGTRDKECSSNEAAMQGNLRLQLLRCQKKIRQLEYSLRIKHKCSNEIMNQTIDKLKAEIQSLQSMVSSTQQMFDINLAKYKDQLKKVGRGDVLVRDLYLQNAQLMLSLQVTEERQKKAEDQVRKLQMSNLASLP